MLRPAHRLTAPSTELWTRTYEAPIRPNWESKLPNPDSHQTHAGTVPIHPSTSFVLPARLATTLLDAPIFRIPPLHDSHLTYEHGTVQPIAGILALVSSSHTQRASSDPGSTRQNCFNLPRCVQTRISTIKLTIRSPENTIHAERNPRPCQFTSHPTSSHEKWTPKSDRKLRLWPQIPNARHVRSCESTLKHEGNGTERVGIKGTVKR
jgi:hypothetical protein